eukprot:5733887-Prorocentrum_lima.AAC.1
MAQRDNLRCERCKQGAASVVGAEDSPRRRRFLTRARLSSEWLWSRDEIRDECESEIRRAEAKMADFYDVNENGIDWDRYSLHVFLCASLSASSAS